MPCKFWEILIKDKLCIRGIVDNIPNYEFL